MLEKQERIKEIDPGRITQPAESMDRIVRPKRDAVGKILDVGECSARSPRLLGD